MTVARSEAPQPAQSLFDSLKREDEFGEWWSARDLMPIYGYTEWRNFSKIINQAKLACATSAHDVSSHFVDTNKIDPHRHKRADFRLTRYAAYLIAMEGDAGKLEIATAKRYFAVQTRRAEIALDGLDPELQPILQNLFELQRVRNEQRRIKLRQDQHDRDIMEAHKVAAEAQETAKDSLRQIEIARAEVAENTRIVERVKKEIIEQADRIEVVERVTPLRDRTGLQDTNQVAKLIGWGEIRLMAALREKGIVYGHSDSGHRPYQKYIDQGWGTAKYVAWTNGRGHSWKPLWTPKGVVEIQRMLHGQDDPEGRLF